MHIPTRQSRAALGTAALVFGMLLQTAPAHAAPPSCTAVRAASICQFSCHAGDLITVDAVGLDGTVVLGGNAICGDVEASCYYGPICHGEATALSSDDGICHLGGTYGIVATCTAGAPNVDPCNLVESLCNGPVRAGCDFSSLATGLEATGDQNTYNGVAYGYAVFDDQTTHTLRCYVQVDGVEAASSSAQSGVGFVGTAGPVTFFAEDGALVEVCTEIDSVTIECVEPTNTQIPPQEVIDALDGVFATIDGILLPIGEQLDTIICPVLASLSPGIAGVVDITPEGDTTLGGVDPVWDCPPYGNLFPPT